MIETKPVLEQDQTSNANQDPASGHDDSSAGAPLSAHIDEDQNDSAQTLDEDDEALAAAMAIMSGTAPTDDSDEESDDDTDSSDDEGSDDPADKTASSSAHTKPKGDSRENKNSPSARIAHFSRLAKINADDADAARLETQRVQRQLSDALHKIDMLSNQLLEMRKLEMQLKELYSAAGMETPQVSHQTPPAATYPSEQQKQVSTPDYAPDDENRPMTVKDFAMAKKADEYRAQIEVAVRNSSNPAVARAAVYKAIGDADAARKQGNPYLGEAVKSLIKMEHGMDILVAMQNSRDDYRTLGSAELTEKIAVFYSKRKGNKTADTRSRSIEQPRGAGAPKEQKNVNFDDPDEADAYLERLRAKRAGRKV